MLPPARKDLVTSQFINIHMKVNVINKGIKHKHGIF